MPTISPPIAQSVPGTYWKWRDNSIYYVCAGERSNKPPLLLVHGFGASTDHWRKNIDQLQSQFQVWAIDLLGFGRSAKPKQEYSGNLWREQLHDFITEVIQQPTVLAGNSLGGWIDIVQPSSNLIKIIIEGWCSAVGIAFAEELLFRGWLLDELQRDYGKKICIWVTAIAYAIAHFLKPLEEIMRTAVTFPALVLLGIALVLAKYKYGDRLGMSIGIHGGLVWGYYVVNVGQLIEYTNKVPVWVTGIDGNPIAGVMGLVFLSGLTLKIIFTRKSGINA